MTRRIELGQLLKEAGLIDDLQLMSMLGHQRSWGGRIGRAAIDLGLIKEEQLVEVVGAQLGVRTMHIGGCRISPAVLRTVPEKLVRARRALPLYLTSHTPPRLVVAFTAPENLTVVDEVAFAAGRRIEPVLAGDLDLDRAIERHFPARVPAPGLSSLAFAAAAVPTYVPRAVYQ